jgi:hypothetical protein
MIRLLEEHRLKSVPLLKIRSCLAEEVSFGSLHVFA